MDYEKDVEIDCEALDVEWLEQASLAGRWGKYLSQLRHRVKKLAEKKKTIRSELICKANDNPDETTGKAKPNAADLESYYRTQDKYKNAVEELHDGEEELEYAELCNKEIAFTRRKALENLVILHGQMFFAGPKVPRNLTEERQARRAQSNRIVGMKRKK